MHLSLQELLIQSILCAHCATKTLTGHVLYSPAPIYRIEKAGGIRAEIANTIINEAGLAAQTKSNTKR